MNKQQFSKAAKIIAKGCLIEGALCEKTEEYPYGAQCALGDLLHAAGVPKKDILDESAPSDEQEQMLEEKYGIDAGMQEKIMGLNDERKSVCGRRKAIIKYMKDCVSETEGAK